jgi:hypothetical protein
MKSRAIALGASVIALTLATGGQAVASELGNLGQDVKAQTQTGVSGSAGSVKVNGSLKVNTKAAVEVPSKGSLGDVTRPKQHASTTVEAKRKSGDDRSGVVLDANTRHGVSAYVDQRRLGRFELEGKGHADARRADAELGGFARHAGKARFHGAASAAKARHGITRSVRNDARKASRKASGKASGKAAWKAGKVEHSTGSDRKPPLGAIGREVANPIQLSLTGWLIGMAIAGGFGVARLVRRLQHLS